MSLFFFFKQKTAYEMLRSLVGSEMCIRDSLNTLLDELYQTFSAKLANKPVELRVYKEFSDNEDEIFVDDLKLRQVLHHLLLNAVKFTHNGSIEFGYRLKSSNLEFYVKDTGIGIAGKKQDVIFERFTQAD